MEDATLRHLGIRCDERQVLWDAPPAVLVEEALRSHEGIMAANGSLSVITEPFTGRSPHDRFIVDTPDVHDAIAWGGVNQPMDSAIYDALRARVVEYLSQRKVLYGFRGIAGASRAHARKFLVVNERASQNLFAHQLLVRPTAEELACYGAPDFTVLAAPGFLCDPARDETNSQAAVIINFAQHEILVAGTGYSGEIKKAVFSVMNYVLPIEDGVLTMHCSANCDAVTGETALFFGLSGTGKTTLSADPGRRLIGDDEHGWAPDGIFNLEGGCYAKTIDLTREGEPDIYDAIRFGSLIENVVVDPTTRNVDYADSRMTENARASYPVSYIRNAVEEGEGVVPNVVLFLTADAFGVLPPIARLDERGAMYHFLSGFTSKVAGTETGIVEPQPTFSTLFGEPFMPLEPRVYARMLGERIAQHRTRVYLVNTGWTGGPYGVGHRMHLADTRLLVTAALSGEIERAGFHRECIMNLDIPNRCEGIAPDVLDPREAWDDKQAYDAAARALARLFQENARRKYPDMASEVAAAGPMRLDF